jgi:hypothetical protein
VEQTVVSAPEIQGPLPRGDSDGHDSK